VKLQSRLSADDDWADVADKTIEVTAEEDWSYSFTNLPKYDDGTEIQYQIVEADVPEGYEASYEAGTNNITNTHAPEKIEISGTKTWVGTSDIQPESVTIQLLADGTVIKEATASEEDNYTYSFTDLYKYADGEEITYTVEEVPVPGYVASYDDEYNVENTLTSVSISKVDVTNGEELIGAHIQILDEDGNIVDEWDSEETAHVVTGLNIGEEYTLRETVAPDGYTITTDTTFILDEDGKISEDSTTSVSEDGTLLVEDDKTQVSVVKADYDGNYVSGAELAILDPETGEVLDTWTTDGTAHDVTGILIAGNTYYLRELAAPSGYLLAEDIEFTVPLNREDNPLELTMVDRPSSEGLGKITVTKNIKELDLDLFEFTDLYANDAVFYVGLFTDPDGRHPYGKPAAIEIRNASSGSVTFENLPNGTYYVYETDESGKIIPLDEGNDGFYCTIMDETESNVVEIDAAAAELEGKVNLTNVYTDWPDGYFQKGDLEVNKVVRVNNVQTDVDDIFYVGIFSERDLETADIAVEELVNNGSIHVEVPIYGDGKETVTYWVYETDENGERMNGAEGFAYTVSGEDSVSFDTGENGLSQTIELVNSIETEEVTPTPTSTPAPTPTPTTTTSKAPKTGDPMNPEWYLLLLAGAFVGMSASLYSKKKRQDDAK
jgi:hypothetical protein